MSAEPSSSAPDIAFVVCLGGQRGQGNSYEPDADIAARTHDIAYGGRCSGYNALIQCKQTHNGQHRLAARGNVLRPQHTPYGM